MADRPKIEIDDWIRVDGRDCVVAKVREAGNSHGDCEVVLTPSKPANRDVRWTGQDWEFVATADYGGYAEKNERLKSAVATLKRGR